MGHTGHLGKQPAALPGNAGQKGADMEYTGKHRIIKNSLICGEDVDILEYRSAEKYSWCECSRCGKPIRKKMYVVQSCATNVELMHLGAECIRHFL